MLTQQRKRHLLDRLKRDGRIVAKDLSAELSLSEDTIRRDLRELAAAGLLIRVHGGALPASPAVADVSARRVMAVAEKQRLAKVGAALLGRGQTAFVDGGTTNLELVRQLPLELVAAIVTHSPQIASALEAHRNIEVIVIGGSLLRHSMVAVGAAALAAIARLRVDVFFLGVTGLHPEEGATTGNYEDAAIKQAIAERAGEVVTLVTAEKIGAVSPYRIGPVEALTTLVVSGGADVGTFRERGLAILTA